jgi:hypothetical protein
VLAKNTAEFIKAHSGEGTPGSTEVQTVRDPATESNTRVMLPSAIDLASGDNEHQSQDQSPNYEKNSLVKLKSLQLFLPRLQLLNHFPTHDAMYVTRPDNKVIIIDWADDEWLLASKKDANEISFTDIRWSNANITLRRSKERTISKNSLIHNNQEIR